MSFKSVLFLVLSFIAGSIAFSGMRTSRMVGSKISMAIPPFNWPGSKMPPSPLESLFSQPIGGGSSSSSSAPVKKSTPAPAKKSAPAEVKSSAKPATKSAAASKAPAKAAAPAAKGKTTNFTWGGRPDPTPEAYVEESADFWGFAKGLGKKK